MHLEEIVISDAIRRRVNLEMELLETILEPIDAIHELLSVVIE